MATWIVGGALALLVVGIAWHLIRDRRAGKGGCGCGCESCPGGCAHAHPKREHKMN